MFMLYDRLVTADVLADEARARLGDVELTCFEGEELDAETARAIAASLDVPPRERDKAILCSFVAVLPRSFDILLAPVEDAGPGRHLFMSLPGPFPETFASRFVRSNPLPIDRARIYQAFVEGSTYDDVCQEQPDLPPEVVYRLYEGFAQSIGVVGSFIAAAHDESREAGLRTCRGFKPTHAELLACELDMQQQGKTMAKQLLTRVNAQRLQRALRLADRKGEMSPPVFASLVLHALC